MSKDWYQDIVDFHRATSTFVGRRPGPPFVKVQKLRLKLIKEETQETLDAIFNDDLVALADGIADSIVVLLGTAVSYGIDIRPIWDEVHKTNMAKVGGLKRKDGKILKPEGWVPPDVKSILVGQGVEL